MLQNWFSFDLQSLRLLCWVVVCVASIVCMLFNAGFMGSALILPYLKDETRTDFITSSRQQWIKNSLFFFAALAFAYFAFPFIFKISFLQFYWVAAFILITFWSLPILSGINKIHSASVKKTGYFMFGFIPVFSIGLMIGNLLLGMPFHYSEKLMLLNEGSFSFLFTIFPLFCGLLSVLMVGMHGAVLITTRASTCHNFAKYLALATIMIYTLGAIFVMGAFASIKALDVKGYSIALSLFKPFDPNAVSNPLNKDVLVMSGGWVGNYIEYKWMMAAPILSFVGVIGVIITLFLKRKKTALVFSSLALIGIVSTVMFSMYPFVVPSSSHPAQSLTIYDSSADGNTLKMLLICVTVFLPAAALWQILEFYRSRRRKGSAG